MVVLLRTPVCSQACAAVAAACRELVGRLQPFAAKVPPEGMSWQAVVRAAFFMHGGFPPLVGSGAHVMCWLLGGGLCTYYLLLLTGYCLWLSHLQVHRNLRRGA
jgi:hypothetical protein